MFVILTLIGIVYYLPINKVLAFVSIPRGYAVYNPEGTLWKGSALAIETPEIRIKNISWDGSILSLFKGYNLSVKDDDLFSGRLHINGKIGQEVIHLSDVKLVGNIENILYKFTKEININGYFSLATPSLYIDIRNQKIKGKLYLKLQNVEVENIMKKNQWFNLGEITVNIETGNKFTDSIQLIVTQESDETVIDDMEITIDKDGKYRIHGKVKILPTASPEIKMLSSFMQVDPYDGNLYSVDYKGHF